MIPRYPTRFSFRRGFTLIELLVVIAIISLLSSVVFASLNGARVKARDAKRIADLRQIQLALEIFYDSYGYYPMTAGGSWDGQWENLSVCLETGAGCRANIGDNSSIAGFVSVMSQVPQDPLDDPATLSDADPTYIYAWPPACQIGQQYRLGAVLETVGHDALGGDLDGSYYANNNGCEDSILGYCIGVGSCPGQW
jgi:prepilin-type N-terminal cleavage/methylation domain-containing protein